MLLKNLLLYWTKKTNVWWVLFQPGHVYKQAVFKYIYMCDISMCDQSMYFYRQCQNCAGAGKWGKTTCGRYYRGSNRPDLQEGKAKCKQQLTDTRLGQSNVCVYVWSLLMIQVGALKNKDEKHCI